MIKKHSGLSILAICVMLLGLIISACQKDPADGFIDQDLKKNKSKMLDSSFAIDEIFDSTFQLEDIINTNGNGSWHKGIPIGLFRRCFELVPPITLIYQDSMQVTYDGLTDLKHDLKTHFDESDEIPEVVYPITLKLKDGTLQEIPDQETLFNTLFTCVPFGFFKKFLNNNGENNEDGEDNEDAQVSGKGNNGNGNNGNGNGNGQGKGKGKGNSQGG